MFLRSWPYALLLLIRVKCVSLLFRMPVLYFILVMMWKRLFTFNDYYPGSVIQPSQDRFPSSSEPLCFFVQGA